MVKPQPRLAHGNLGLRDTTVYGKDSQCHERELNGRSWSLSICLTITPLANLNGTMDSYNQELQSQLPHRVRDKVGNKLL